MTSVAGQAMTIKYSCGHKLVCFVNDEIPSACLVCFPPRQVSPPKGGEPGEGEREGERFSFTTPPLDIEKAGAHLRRGGSLYWAFGSNEWDFRCKDVG